MARGEIRRYSPGDLEERVARGDYVSTRKDAPEIEPDEEFWRNAREVVPSGKKSVHLRLVQGSGPGLSDPDERRAALLHGSP